MKKKLGCVLLVDDDKATNFLNHRLLTKMEIASSIVTAKNGREAIEYLHKSHDSPTECAYPDLIFLDINMPLVNGWEFLNDYNDLPDDYQKSAVIIMLTTSLRASDEQLFRETKTAKKLLHKPLTEEKVQRILKEDFPFSES